MLEPPASSFQVVPVSSVGTPSHKGAAAYQSLLSGHITKGYVCQACQVLETRLSGEARMSSVSTDPDEGLPKTNSGSKKRLQLLPSQILEQGEAALEAFQSCKLA